MGFLSELASQPGLTAVLAVFFWMLSTFILRALLSALLKMHRSKTAVKKICKSYSFRQRLLLRHVREHTLHAVKFAGFLIRVHHVSAVTMALCLICGTFLSGQMFVYLLCIRFLILDAPVLLLMELLDEKPFIKRHTWSFLKYHNTPDKTSLR